MDDLAVTYYVQIKNDEMGNASVAINEDMMKQYGLTEEGLHEIASANMDMEAKPENIKDDLVDEALQNASAPGVDVLSNEEKYNGAAMLLSEKAMDMVRMNVGEDFFILPSSVVLNSSAGTALPETMFAPLTRILPPSSTYCLRRFLVFELNSFCTP